MSDIGSMEAKAAVAEKVLGLTRIGEMLLVDVRIARRVDEGSELHAVCQALADRGAAGVIDATFVIDLLDADAAQRALVLDHNNWPLPEGRDGEAVRVS